MLRQGCDRRRTLCQQLPLYVVAGAVYRIRIQAIELASQKKYGWPMQPHSGGKIYRLSPHTVFAFPLKQIATAVTRWVFE